MFCHSIGDSDMEMGNIRANSNGRGDVANIIWDKSIQLRVSGTENSYFYVEKIRVVEKKAHGRHRSKEAKSKLAP